ncbi:MAG: dihydrodipicolinate synthase family protein, partial [Saprospiraceae bacterium]|nr:dihydrodipicolinate synthase family protein [Saprospiraceae bacterium]
RHLTNPEYLSTFNIRTTMKTLPWTGVYPAVTTKFTEKGFLDLDAFLFGIHAQVKAGVDGIIIGGSLGESSTITHDERIAMLSATLEQIDHEIPVLINIAEGSTKQAVALAQRAEASGAHGLMVLPPMMYTPTDQEVIDFFSDIASGCGLPILVYNNPVDYKIEVTPRMFEILLKHDTIQAVKESTRDLSNVTRLINAFGDRLKILTGVDTIAMEALVMGAHGWVAGLVNAFPAETVSIYQLVKAGRMEEARAIHRWFLPILELDINAQLVQNIKLAEHMTDLGNEYVRLPRQPLHGSERQRVIRILEAGIATRPVLPDYLHL